MLNFLLAITDESNRELIEHLYNKYHDDMIRLARNRLKFRGIESYELDSEDIVQNAFFKVVKYIDAIDFAKPEEQVKAYIFSIVVNETKNFIADKEIADNIDGYLYMLSDDDFFKKMKVHMQYDMVVEQIKQLDEKYSITMLLYYCEDMDVKAISKIMGIAEKTVYTRLERGKRLLLDKLPQEELL